MSRTVLGLALLATGLAFAAPEAPPAPGPTPPFELPTTTAFTLKNGLKVTLVPYGAIPKTHVALALRLGNADEAAHQTGLADSWASSSSRAPRRRARCSWRRPRRASAARWRPTSARTTPASRLSASAIPRWRRSGSSPRWPALRRSRRRSWRDSAETSCAEVAIQRSQPQPLAEEAFAQAIYGNHPYGRVLPVAADVEKFSLEQAKQLWTRFAGADRAHLYVVGRFDPAAVRTAVEEAFGGWHRAKGAPRPKAAPKGGRRVFLLDRPGAVQSTVRFGLPAIPPTSPDYIPLLVTDALLGGSFGSRITANIREKRGYTYSPRSVLGLHPGVGTWAEAADVTTKDTAASVREIVNEIERLRKEPPSDEELAGIRKYVAGTFVLRNSSRAGIVTQLRFVDLHGLPADWLRTFVQRVQAVTPTDVTRVTKKYLEPQRMTLVVVGDRKVVEDSLKQFGPVKVEAPK